MADILTTERLTFKFRLLALLAVGLASFLADADGDRAKLVVLLTVYLVYALVVHWRLPYWPRPQLVYAMILVDAVFLFLVSLLIGKAASLITVLIPLTVPFYAVFGAYLTAFITATVMLLVFALIQVANGREALSTAFFMQVPLYYLLAALTGYLATGRIRRLQDQEALQRLVRLENEARSLSGAARTIQESLDLGLTLQEMCVAAPRLTGIPDCLIGLLDRRSGALVTRATTTDISRLGVDRLDYLVEWPRDGAVTDEALALREPIAIYENTLDAAGLPAWAARVGVRSMLVAPMISRGVDVGIMYFYGTPAGYRFSEQDMTLAQSYADIVALVAVNAQLYEDVQATIASVISDLRPVVMPKPAAKARKLSVIEVGDLVVDLPARQAKIDGRVVGLTPTEFDLLSVLAENSGSAVDQDTLLKRVWGDDYTGRSTVVDVGLHRLRRKIEEGQGTHRRIVTVRGSGYMLVPASSMTRQGAES